MGIAFSESTNKTGLCELLDDLVKTNPTDYSLYKKARDINSAFVRYMMIAIKSSGKWQVDDTNQTDYPIIKINVVSGQADYPFTSDASTIGNQILDITRVEIASSSGVFTRLDAYDQTDEDDSLQQKLNVTTGIPYRYDKLANGVFLDPKPNYNYTQGLVIYFQRTPVYFLNSDTTKQAGIPDMFHEYLAYRPAYLYALSNGLSMANGYLNFITNMEKDIADYYAGRNRDEHRIMSTNSRKRNDHR